MAAPIVADAATIYVAKRLNQNLTFLNEHGLISNTDAAYIQTPLLPFMANRDVGLTNLTWNAGARGSVQPAVLAGSTGHAMAPANSGPSPFSLMGVPASQAPAQPAAPPEEELAFAMYDYTASASDELTFKKGSVLVVRSRPSDDWYSGYVQPRAGGSAEKPLVEKLFPANYVELLPPRTAVAANGQVVVPESARNSDRLKKIADSPAGQAAVGGFAFGAAAGLASRIF